MAAARSAAAPSVVEEAVVKGFAFIFEDLFNRFLLIIFNVKYCYDIQ